MNYPLLITVCSLAAGLVGMERWCSWRLNVAQKRSLSPGDVPARDANVPGADENRGEVGAGGLRPGVVVG